MYDLSGRTVHKGIGLVYMIEQTNLAILCCSFALNCSADIELCTNTSSLVFEILSDSAEQVCLNTKKIIPFGMFRIHIIGLHWQTQVLIFFFLIQFGQGGDMGSQLV